MTHSEIEDILKRIEGVRARNSLQWERMYALSLEADGLTPREIAVTLSRAKEEANRKNTFVMSRLRKAFRYDAIRASRIQRDWAANDEEICELNKPLRSLA